jgi:hypothetical protein
MKKITTYGFAKVIWLSGLAAIIVVGVIAFVFGVSQKSNTTNEELFVGQLPIGTEYIVSKATIENVEAYTISQKKSLPRLGEKFPVLPLKDISGKPLNFNDQRTMVFLGHFQPQFIDDLRAFAQDFVDIRIYAFFLENMVKLEEVSASLPENVHLVKAYKELDPQDAYSPYSPQWVTQLTPFFGADFTSAYYLISDKGIVEYVDFYSAKAIKEIIQGKKIGSKPSRLFFGDKPKVENPELANLIDSEKLTILILSDNLCEACELVNQKLESTLSEIQQKYEVNVGIISSGSPLTKVKVFNDKNILSTWYSPLVTPAVSFFKKGVFLGNLRYIKYFIPTNQSTETQKATIDVFFRSIRQVANLEAKEK